MKELTIEEKAKAYDEALDRAKKVHRYSSDLAEIKRIEDIFPELIESEDGKIRNFLIDFIKVCHWTEKVDQGWPLREECIAWLEKQGESIKIKKGKNYLCTKTHKYAGVEWIKGTKYYASDNYTLVNQGCECYCPEYSKEEHNNLFEEVKYDGCVEKQGKQKQDVSIQINLKAEYERGKANAQKLVERHMKKRWRPTETQMASLLVAVGDEKKLGSDAYKDLYNLYLQLKQL